MAQNKIYYNCTPQKNHGGLYLGLFYSELSLIRFFYVRTLFNSGSS